MKSKFLLFLAFALSLVAADSAATRWWRDVRFLAGDSLQGRNTGSEGYRKAAEYVVAQFEKAGLKPAGTNGWLQPVHFDVRRIREDQSVLSLTRGGVQTMLDLGEDGYFSLRSDPSGVIRAPAVFAGYGLTVPELKYNDLAGMDLRGKIAVYLQGGPSSIPGALRAHYQSTAERWSFLRRSGAIGVAVIPNPRSMDIPWDRAKLSRLQPAMSLADQRFNETAGQKIALVINPASADKFFAGTGHTMAEILAAADSNRPLPKFPLAVSIQASIAVERSMAESDNVIGVLDGSDPKLKDEYVAVSAHLDHLGTGAAVKGDSVYNGAMDNASGVASLLEIARTLHSSRARPRRSVLFAVVTAEEKGLLGSKYFAAYPTVPAKQLVADLNVDMFLPLYPLRILQVFGLGESSLGSDLRAVAKANGVLVQGDPEPERNRFIRSDQYSFVRAGIPALTFKVGFAKGSPEEQKSRAWLKTRYHAPSDDANQPMNLEAAAKFNSLLEALVERVANDKERPRWNSSSFFRRFAR